MPGANHCQGSDPAGFTPLPTPLRTRDRENGPNKPHPAGDLWLSSHPTKRDFEFIFLSDPEKRQGFGAHHTSALKNPDILNVIVSGLLLTEEVSQASLSRWRCVGKSGCIKRPAPALSPSLQCLRVPLTPSSFHTGNKRSNFTAVPLPSHCHPLPFLACPLPLHSPTMAAAPGRGADGGWALLFPLCGHDATWAPRR